ncbi:hypothetical protein GCM10010358_81420 [Streptomyces minutiscleroticus]|uniref:SH3b domain-containing protein n=1 Tax=Streptomyces minutiscleroticus TaxID=68238 RepID=A0A918P3A4_9ACTN|nr:SH3 domain-containing protein [Streptomyces minutiscleroticus]GGY17807.1 hypothetical protein GCM10010358_81420 [Streptomyces minutiscleroticus]
MRFMKRGVPGKLQRAMVGIAATGLVATGALAAGVVTATPASAVGKSACAFNREDVQTLKTTTNVNLRNGPSTSYTSLGLLAKGTKYDPYCADMNTTWYYGKVLSGANAGTWGWVKISYLAKA